MDLHDLGGVVWAIFIVIAVISSIIRSAKRSMGNAQVQQQQMRVQQRVAPPAPAAAARAPIVVKHAPVARVVAPPPPPPSPVRAMVFPTATARKRERLFGPGISVVRGIVALEVLGPPRAMREWTPLV